MEKVHMAEPLQDVSATSDENRQENPINVYNLTTQDFKIS